MDWASNDPHQVIWQASTSSWEGCRYSFNPSEIVPILLKIQLGDNYILCPSSNEDRVPIGVNFNVSVEAFLLKELLDLILG